MAELGQLMGFKFWSVLSAKENGHHLQLGVTICFHLFCTVPVHMSARWLQRGPCFPIGQSRLWLEEGPLTGSSQLRRRVLCRYATSQLQLGSIMLVVAFLVLREKRLTAVILACPKQLPSSCTSYSCCGHFGWANPFLFLLASPGVL